MLESASWGGLPGARGVSGPGGSAWCWGGLPGAGGCLPGPGGCLPGPRGGLASQHALRQTPSPPVDRHTHVKTLPWPQLRCGR